MEISVANLQFSQRSIFLRCSVSCLVFQIFGFLSFVVGALFLLITLEKESYWQSMIFYKKDVLFKVQLFFFPFP